MFKQRNLETSLEDTSAKLTAKPDYEMRFSRVSILNLNASIAWHISWARRHTISIARMFSCGLLITLLVLYIIWDVNYFIRCVATLGYGMLFQRKRRVTDQTSIYGLCTTQDVDIFIRHMNNARYVRELDFARFHFYALTGIYGKIKAKGGGAVQGASSVRYRRTIPIFSAYKITTRLVWWDDKAIYLEQQFVTLGDGFVRAVAMSKQCITKVDVVEMMKQFPGAEQRPEMPEELRQWLEAIETSSQKLRKEK